MSSWGTIHHRAKSDLKGINTNQTFYLIFFHISECTIKAPESVHFPLPFHIGNSSLHFGKGISKLHNGFFVMSLTIPAPCTLHALAGCCPPQQCSCPCAEGRLLIMLTTRVPGQVSPQHRGQAASRAPNFLMCKRKETEAIRQLLLFIAKARTDDSTQVCFLQTSAREPKLEADATAS